MSEYTPSTEEVRESYVVGVDPEVTARYRAEFDRWLAERDRQVKADAWDEGEQAGLRRADFEYGHATIQAVRRNPYREGQGDE